MTDAEYLHMRREEGQTRVSPSARAEGHTVAWVARAVGVALRRLTVVLARRRASTAT